jgi:hypothetical protein
MIAVAAAIIIIGYELKYALLGYSSNQKRNSFDNLFSGFMIGVILAEIFKGWFLR